MSKLSVYNSKGKEVGSVSLDKDLLKERVNTRVLYYAVNNYMASWHRGTHKTKTRREVSGGGKKPWRQKGTGRARVGSSRNPLWRSGGIAFGPRARSYTYSIPRKVKRLALIEAIKSKIQADNFVVFESISLEKPKTKDMASVIRALKLGNKGLMVMEKIDKNVKLASRNIPGFLVKKHIDVNAFDVLKHNKLAISQGSFEKLLKG